MSTGFYDRTPEPARPEVEVEPYPAPEVSSRDGVPGPAKPVVAALAVLAEACGWDVLVTYSRGHLPHATTGRPGALTDVLMVRMERGAERAYASYVGGGKTWKWDSMASWRKAQAGTWTSYGAIGMFQDMLFGMDHGPARPWKVVRKVCFFRVPAMGTHEHRPAVA